VTKRAVMTLVIISLFAVTSACAQEYGRLIQEAEAKMSASQYGDALGLYQQAFELGNAGLKDLFNAACAAARSGNSDVAFLYLNKALQGNLIEEDWFEEDEDLAGLHSDDRWGQLLAAVDAKIEAAMVSFPETHPEEPAIDLPEPRATGDISIEEALKNRRSVRAYGVAPLSLADVSQLLWAAYGLNKPIEGAPRFLRGGLRTAPSAGALYPLELYLVARNVTGLEPGIYWYKSETHRLVLLAAQDRWEDLSSAAFDQPHFETAAAAIVYSAVFERNTETYGRRGRERYVCMDLGHSAENVYLQAYALKIGTCAIGAFNDLALKQVIGMTRAEEPLYIMPLGKLE
jgi:SagB-type dehydrogenase family enzyme